MNKKKSIKSIILKTPIENIHVAPATNSLMQTNMKSYRNKNDALILNNSLKDVKKHYDNILIDTPPSYGHFIINAAFASDEVILVLDPGIFALESIESLHEIFDEYGKKVGKDIKVTKALLTKCQKTWVPFSKTPTKEIGDELRNIYKEVYTIPYSNKVYKSQINGLPISHYKPKSNVGLSYQKIAEAILE